MMNRSHASGRPKLGSVLDATHDRLHGQQERRLLHGYCDCSGYLPLYISCGDRPPRARLRRSDQDGAAGSAQTES